MLAEEGQRQKKTKRKVFMRSAQDITIISLAAEKTKPMTGSVICIQRDGWLVGCFGLNGPLRQYFSLYRAVSQREE